MSSRIILKLQKVAFVAGVPPQTPYRLMLLRSPHFPLQLNPDYVTVQIAGCPTAYRRYSSLKKTERRLRKCICVNGRFSQIKSFRHLKMHITFYSSCSSNLTQCTAWNLKNFVQIPRMTRLKRKCFINSKARHALFVRWIQESAIAHILKNYKFITDYYLLNNTDRVVDMADVEVLQLRCLFAFDSAGVLFIAIATPLRCACDAAIAVRRCDKIMNSVDFCCDVAEMNG